MPPSFPGPAPNLEYPPPIELFFLSKCLRSTTFSVKLRFMCRVHSADIQWVGLWENPFPALWLPSSSFLLHCDNHLKVTNRAVLWLRGKALFIRGCTQTHTRSWNINTYRHREDRNTNTERGRQEVEAGGQMAVVLIVNDHCVNLWP